MNYDFSISEWSALMERNGQNEKQITEQLHLRISMTVFLNGV